MQWLLAGLFIAMVLKMNDSLKKRIKKTAQISLQMSIVLLGSRIPLNQLMTDAWNGMQITFISVAATIGAAFLLRNFLFKSVSDQQMQLISGGTSICGGSAIAAISPAIGASHTDTAISLSVVFILNAFALLIFPLIGKFVGLNDIQFAHWAALAIHDTSSVTGAALQWSSKALELATTLKLSRTLWIFPIVLFFSWFNRKKAKSNYQFSFPYFVLGFVIVSFLFSHSALNIPAVVIEYSTILSSFGFKLSLFLIGLTLSIEAIKKVGFAPFFYGTTLWLLTAITTLTFVLVAL